ncbi:MAG TPA: GTP cyclohydrolase MptA [Anaerolineae bacterium]|nr:GTP cyclohydrolase MptA [Anaerolineae bacterium]
METANSTPVYIALGSNLGDRRSNLIDAISQLRQKVDIDRISAVYETEPAYVTDQPRFYNMVLSGTTALPPHELLRFLKSIERRMGRERKIRYGPRPIDLDILVYGDLRLETDTLTIPHPRIAERAFVLVPLAEIAPQLVIPGLAFTVAELAKQLDDDAYGQIVQATQKLARHFPRDVQEEEPPAPLSLTHVGVSGLKRIIRLAGADRDDLFYAEMDLYVEVRPEQKGAHMSRFSDTVEEIISEVSQAQVPTLEALAERIAREILRDQRAFRSDVRIRANFPQERYAPVSGKLTQEIYTLIGLASVTEERVARVVGVEAEGMMACPCAQDMVADQTHDRLLEAGFSAQEAERILNIVPLATHNQRGRGTLLVGTAEPVRAQELVNIVEAAMSSENYDLLKRADELFVVTKAHRYPRFVEDAVREIIVGLIELYPDLPDDTFVLARQVNFETIHKHDVYAERAGTLDELRQELSQRNYVRPHTTLDSWLRGQLNLATSGLSL